MPAYKCVGCYMSIPRKVYMRRSRESYLAYQNIHYKIGFEIVKKLSYYYFFNLTLSIFIKVLQFFPVPCFKIFNGLELLFEIRSSQHCSQFRHQKNLLQIKTTFKFYLCFIIFIVFLSSWKILQSLA